MSRYDWSAGKACDSVTGQPHPHGDESARTKAAGIVRSLLLGAAVFTLAAMTGALLAGTAPAVPAALSGAGALEWAAAVGWEAADTPAGSGAGQEATEAAPERAEVASVQPFRSRQAEARAASEALFAQSMIYSGTAGLTLSIAGLVMVGRRRRYW
jgi:hypothetical protein